MKNLFAFLSLFALSYCAFSQEKVQDSTKVETLDEVLVKAVRVNATSPITHSNVTKKQIEKRNLGQDIPVLLNYLPSVVTTSDAGAGVGYTGIRVRGINAQSTNVTINGIPYNDAESLGTFWVNLGDFASSVESLQLQRGVGTSTNGSGAFGASVNVLTDAISNQAKAEISNAFGSFNTRKHTVKFSTGKLFSDTERSRSVEIAGRLSQINSDGYIDRAETDLKSYFLQASYIDDNTLIKAITFGGKEVTYQAWNGIDAETLETNRTFNSAGIYTDANGDTQFYDNEVDNYNQDHYQLHWNQRYNNNWSTNIGLNYTYGRGYFEQYKEDEDFLDYNLDEIVIGGETINTTDLIRRRWLDNDFYVLNMSANYKNNALDLTFGTSVSHYDGDHFGEIIWAQYTSNSTLRGRYYEGNGLKNDFSTFAKATYRVNDKVSLYGDLQLRLVNYKTTGLTSDRIPFNVDENYSFFNPKAGITYRLNSNNSIYFSYARANREPNRDDFENNADVKPEQLNDFELGWRHNTKTFKINTNIYYMLYNEQLVLTGQIDNVGNPIRTNSGKSSRLGLEIDAAIAISSKFSIQPNITLSSNKNKETIASIDGVLTNLGRTNISFSPELVAANALVFQPKKNLQLSLLSKYVGEQFMVNTDDKASKLDSYFVNDFNVTYEVKPKSIFKSIVLSGLVNNIFNKEYVSNGADYGGGYIYYYPQATTNFLIGATLKF
ncbi:TonB-dependent receptor [Ichthyenterobacterium magnum]|uniref:Iron complex outermembrane receptor protein n=1 Tax=Ichthyenterobacterium magnum TaxID=1230530 RepID=A0A420DWD0_9FLAO|nr:TonB-dependent receptor [Ichthyenterobacterium magnum]RKE98537.1 iron complex outermembrane receptor protein [Ichthyenterobacterium magnum]